MKLFLAVCWTIVLVSDIANCALGGTPTWVSVFCPLSVVVIDAWLEWLTSRK